MTESQLVFSFMTDTPTEANTCPVTEKRKGRPKIKTGEDMTRADLYRIAKSISPCPERLLRLFRYWE
jgi:hypothetical protein